MAQQVTQDHRLLKAVVIGLGLLIVIGFGALVIGIAVKGGDLAGKPGGAVPLVLPEGASIADMALSERQLALRVATGEKEELVLIDLKTGKVISRIPVVHGSSGH